MKNLYRIFPFVSLLCLALLVGGLWRWEVEYHGWQGLIWVGYFHLAVPVGFALFLVWTNLFLKAGWVKRIVMNTLVVVFAFYLYRYLAISLYVNYNIGPSGFVMVMSVPRSTLIFYSNLLNYLIPFMPIGAWMILRLFRYRVRVGYVILSIVSVVLSVPLASWILEWTHHKGGSDFLHAIKSGILAALWVFSLGVLVLGVKKGLHQHPDPRIWLERAKLWLGKRSN